VKPDLHSLPENPSQLSAEFLTPILWSAGVLTGGAIRDVQAESLPGALGYNAQIARLYLKYDHPEAGAPEVLIAKLPTVKHELHQNAAVFQPGRKESWFYRQGAARTPVSIPRCYYNAVDPKTGESFLLLEDLAPARRGERIEGLSLEEARLALQAAAALHAAWWEVDPSSEAELEGLVSNTEGEQNLVERLYAAAWLKFLEFKAGAIPDDFIRLGERLVGHIVEAEALLSLSPRTLIHGDLRAENLFFGQRGGTPTCWVIDWEDILLWNGMLDAAWLIGGCLPAAMVDREVELLGWYHEALCRAGVEGYSFEQCTQDYRCAMLSSLVQGVLTMAGLDLVDDTARALFGVLLERFAAASRRMRLQELLG
jgi:hypothetical protein